MTNEIIITGIAAGATALAARITWNHFIKTVDVPAHFQCVHTRFGRQVAVLDAGRYRFFGSGHAFKMFDTRETQLVLQTQELTTAEGLTVKMTAVGVYRVVDPLKVVSVSAEYTTSLYTAIQLALRDAVNGLDMETLLSKVRNIGSDLNEAVKEKATALGLELKDLVVRDVILPSDVKSSLSETWRSKKSAMAELEVARGKAAATRCLANSARLFESNPAMLKLRYIEALEKAANGMGNTFVVGMPDDKTLKNI